MFCKNIASLFVAKQNMLLAKGEIFTTDILWESCSKFNSKQLFHSMSCWNIASLAGIKETQKNKQTVKKKSKHAL